MALRDLETITVLDTEPLTVNGRSVFSKEFPMGEGWYYLLLRINIVVTIGTGAGAISEGELLLIKNILLTTDRGETAVNLPGRALYKIATSKSGTLARKDAIAAASGTYSVDLPIYFVDDALLRPEDTILDTARYNSVKLDVQIGTVADLYTTVGTSSITVNMDAEIVRSKGVLPEQAQPILYINYDSSPPIDAASATTIDIERSSDLAIKRLYAHASTSGSAGVPWSGANSDAIQLRESIRDQSNFIVQERHHATIQNENKRNYSLEAVQTGVTVFDFVLDGSIRSVLLTGDKSRLQYVWTNQGGVGANSIVTATWEGVRRLK